MVKLARIEAAVTSLGRDRIAPRDQRPERRVLDQGDNTVPSASVRKCHPRALEGLVVGADPPPGTLLDKATADEFGLGRRMTSCHF